MEGFSKSCTKYQNLNGYIDVGFGYQSFNSQLASDLRSWDILGNDMWSPITICKKHHVKRKLKSEGEIMRGCQVGQIICHFILGIKLGFCIIVTSCQSKWIWIESMREHTY